MFQEPQAGVVEVGTFAETQSVAAGTVTGVTVAGNWTTPKPAPPNSPATAARWEPGATARPFVPKVRFAKSGEKSWMFVGAVHVPGVPAVNVAPDRLTNRSFCVNSILATATPVLQSSAVASRSPPVTNGAVALYTAPRALLMIWNLLFFHCGRISV